MPLKCNAQIKRIKSCIKRFLSQARLKNKKQNLKTLQLSESSETLAYNYKTHYLRHNMM